MSPSIGISLGVRPLKLVQFDAAVDVTVRAFQVQGSINTTGGRRGVSDRELMGLFGARLVFPVGQRVRVDAGGGYAIANYAEYAVARGNETILGFGGDSAAGSGSYEFVQASVLPTRGRWSLGFRLTWRQVTTSGNFETNRVSVTGPSKWLGLGGTLGIRLR